MNNHLQTHQKTENSLPIVLQTQEDFQQAIYSQKPVLVEFYKIGCPYCKEIEPLIKEVAKELTPNMKVYVMKLNNTTKEKYKKAYGFSAFPRCALFQNEQKIDLLDIKSEELTKKRLIEWIASYTSTS